MTKYVLNSGGVKNAPKLKKLFHLELVKGLGNAPKFLLCNFAQPRENWEEKYPSYCNSIREDLPKGCDPQFELAFPAEFEDQIKNSDIVYVHGGDDALLAYWMKQFDLQKLLEGKVYAGSSAGSELVATNYWTCDWRHIGNGLGILPIKFIPHFESQYGADDPRGPVNWRLAEQELTSYGDTSLPVYALKEGEFEVFEA